MGMGIIPFPIYMVPIPIPTSMIYEIFRPIPIGNPIPMHISSVD